MQRVEFKYDLDQVVVITESNQRGVVKGVAAYANMPNGVLVQHVDGTGDLVRRWYDEDDVSAD